MSKNEKIIVSGSFSEQEKEVLSQISLGLLKKVYESGLNAAKVSFDSLKKEVNSRGLNITDSSGVAKSIISAKLEFTENNEIHYLPLFSRVFISEKKSEIGVCYNVEIMKMFVPNKKINNVFDVLGSSKKPRNGLRIVK